MVPRDSWWGSDDDILRHLQSARQEGYRQGIEDALAWGGMIPAEARDLTNKRRKAPSAAALARENERLRNAADTRAEAEARIAALEADQSVGDEQDGRILQCRRHGRDGDGSLECRPVPGHARRAHFPQAPLPRDRP